jgi:hypothetical protein
VKNFIIYFILFFIFFSIGLFIAKTIRDKTDDLNIEAWNCEIRAICPMFGEKQPVVDCVYNGIKGDFWDCTCGKYKYIKREGGQPENTEVMDDVPRL